MLDGFCLNESQLPTVCINIGVLPVASYRFFNPFNVALAASRSSALACE